MLIMHRSPRISGHALRILAIVLACLLIAGLLIFFTSRAAAAQASATRVREAAPVAQTGARSVVILLLKGEDTQKYAGMHFLASIEDRDYDYVRSMYATIGFPEYAEFVGQ